MGRDCTTGTLGSDAMILWMITATYGVENLFLAPRLSDKWRKSA
jgi:hypothetical protein